MKKLLLPLLLILSITSYGYANERKVFPEQGILSFGGLDDTSPPTLIKDGRASDLQNITLGNFGTAQKRYGYSTLIGTLDTHDAVDSFEAVTSIYELHLSAGTRYTIATCGSKVFYNNSGTWTHITGGLTITEGGNYQWSWITALDYAIGTNGTDPPIKWSGSGDANQVSFSGLSSSITKAKAVAWWKNYLIFGNTTEGGTDHKTRIRWSNVGTIDTWTDADYVDIATLGGQEIEGFGIMYDELYVFLTDSIYKVSLVGGDELITISKVSEGLGCIAKNSIQNIQIGNVENLVFLSRNNTVNTINGVKVEEISTLIEATMDNLNYTRFPYAVSIDDSRNSHYYLAVTNSTGNTKNNLLLDFNYAIGEWSKHTGIEANALGIANDSLSVPRVYFGNYNAFIYQLNNENLNSDVYALTGTFDDADIIDTTTASGLRVLYDYEIEDYVKLLMHFDGLGGSTQFIDNTTKTITVYGNAQLTTEQYKFSPSSGLFDGVGDYLTTPDHTDWDFGTEDFTIDLWVRFSDVTKTNEIINTSNGDATVKGYTLNWSSALLLRFNATTGAGSWDVVEANKTWSPSVDTWYHIAVVRYGNNITLYVDGVSLGNTDCTGDTIDSAGTMYIGRDYLYTTSDFSGYMDELRISKGIARYTAAFTPATSAYDNSGYINTAAGGLLTITSGIGVGETSVIASTTSTGLIVVDSNMTATGVSVYSIGGIDSYYTTKWYDMGSSLHRKNFDTLFLWVRSKTAHTMDLSYATDYVNTIQTKTTSDYDYTSLWGTQINTSGEWTGEELDLFEIPLNCSGRFLKLKFEEDDLDEEMYLKGYAVINETLDIY